MDKIPVNIISGFLGSGKTTAIIQLLHQKPAAEQWAVIINEFGKISIDSQTLRSSSSDAGSIFEISGGCICCSAKGYFHENLGKISGSGKYNRILIEPSGLGGVEMVSEIVEGKPDLRLMPVICLVDITCIENSRLQALPVYRTQISKADFILFSKCDLLEDQVRQKRLILQFKSLFPEKQHFAYSSDPLLLLFLLDSDKSSEKIKSEYRMISQNNPELTDNNYHQETYQFNDAILMDPDQLSHFFTSYPDIIRAKGHIRTPDGWQLLNFTLSGCSFEPCQAKKQNEILIIMEKSAFNWGDRMNDEIKKAIISGSPNQS